MNLSASKIFDGHITDPHEGKSAFNLEQLMFSLCTRQIQTSLMMTALKHVFSDSFC